MTNATPQHRVTRVLPALYSLRTAAEFPAHALRVVRRAVAANKGDYTQLDLLTGDFKVFVDPEPAELEGLADARRAHMREHPVLPHFLRNPGSGSRQISDFLTPVAFRRLGLYGNFFALLGVEHQLTVLISPVGSTTRIGISVDRDRHGFDDADRLVLDLLRPHLTTALANAHRFSAASAASSRSDRESDQMVEQLTDRQRDVLTYVARGLTDAQIGFALEISQHTVRKHVEHILRRLGVATRTAAAAAYLMHESPPPAQAWTAAIPSFVDV